MKKYETIFVLKSTLEDDARDAQIERFKGIIEEKGEVESVEEWGVRRLAYEIEKHREGYYVLVNFKAQTDHPREIERNFKNSDDVLRYIVVSRQEA